MKPKFVPHPSLPRRRESKVSLRLGARRRGGDGSSIRSASLRTMRRVLAACAALALGMPTLPARAALTCEQIFAVLESAVQFRDQGYSLQQVLVGLKDKEIEAKLSAEEIKILHKSVTAVYLGNATAEEVALACKEAQRAK